MNFFDQTFEHHSGAYSAEDCREMGGTNGVTGISMLRHSSNEHEMPDHSLA
jgi:hypothetical protein